MEKIQVSKEYLKAVGCDFKNKVVKIEFEDDSKPFLLKPSQLTELLLNTNWQIKIPGTNRLVKLSEVKRVTTYTGPDIKNVTPRSESIIVASPTSPAS